LLFVPTIGLLLLLAIVPLIFSLGISLFNYSLGSKPIWLGLGNYINMFTDPQFWLATKVTLQFTVAAVSIEVVLGVLLGFVMNQRFTGMGIIRLIVFLPMMLAPLVVGLFWRFMFDQTFGVINYLLTEIGLPAILCLTRPLGSLTTC
jgi:multiple sugar transport system permease protein